MVNLCIGQRIICDGFLGTIKYIGLVDGTKNDWVGVVWDDPSRGRHNGNKNGKVYFECEDNAGSFIRPHKVNTGISLWQALLDRYTAHNEVAEEMSIHTLGGGKFTLETVGMEKVQQQFEKLNQLEFLGLRDQCISSLGERGKLESIFENLEDLDLSKNLLSSWTEVAAIAKELKNLHVLNLSSNILSIPEERLSLAPSFLSLRVLVLNSCKLTWTDLTKCFEMFNDIEELNVENNNIGEITGVSESLFSKLRYLNVSHNKIEDWKNISNLKSLPNLETLLASNCELSNCKISEEDFQQLKKISLTENKYDSLEIFNELHNLQNLEEVMFKSNPIIDKFDDPETFRGHVIAKVGRLHLFNRSIVTHSERQSSELDYLKHFGAAWKEEGGHQDPNLNNPSESFNKSHPRFAALIQKFGAPSDSQIYKKSTALLSSLLEVHISIPSRPEISTLTKRLPSSMTVGRIKMLIRRLLKISLDEYSLAYVNQFDQKHVIEMEKESDTLHSLSFQSGDIIHLVYPNEIKHRLYAFERISTRNETSQH